MRPTPFLVATVGLGGTVGTAGRYAVSHLLPHTSGIPWATLTVNVSGAFLLGVLLGALLRQRETPPVQESPRAHAARLGLGTGVLGGFTTYSAVSLELHDQLMAGHLVLAVSYGVGSVLLGVLASVLGIVLAGTWRGDATPSSGSDVSPA